MLILFDGSGQKQGDIRFIKESKQIVENYIVSFERSLPKFVRLLLNSDNIIPCL